MKKDNLRFFRRLKRFNYEYFRRKIYDRKILKEMESCSGTSRLSLKLEYGLYVKKTLKKRKLDNFSIRRYTNDKFTRYAYLAIKS